MENLSQLIHRLGINATYRGYHYLYRAVLLVLSDEDYLLSITKKMYLDIAAYYGIPVSNVERNLRTVITIYTPDEHHWEVGQVRESRSDFVVSVIMIVMNVAMGVLAIPIVQVIRDGMDLFV